VSDTSVFFHFAKAFTHGSAIIVGVTVQIHQKWESVPLLHTTGSQMTLWWAAKSSRTMSSFCQAVQSSKSESHIDNFYGKLGSF